MKLSWTVISSVIALIVAAPLTAAVSSAQEASRQPDTLLEISFHHIVIDMTDSLAEVTEMLVFHNRSSMPYPDTTARVGIEIPLAKGFSNLRLSGAPEDWELEAFSGGVIYTPPLRSGMTRLVVPYDLSVEDGLVEFVQGVAHFTGRFLFVTSDDRIALESQVLSEREPIQSGEREVKGLSARDLSPGSVVTVVARLEGPESSRRGTGGLMVLGSMIVLYVVIYATARLARAASTSETRLKRLENETRSIVKAMEEHSGRRRQALSEKLAAKQRLVDLIGELNERGTEG